MLSYVVSLYRYEKYAEFRGHPELQKVDRFDAHESVHRAMIKKVTNKMQLHRLIYYC
jgi:hypothetical protein